MRRQIISIKEDTKAPENPTLFHHLLSADIPESEKSVERLTDEANTVIGAGQETVAWILTVIVTHLLTNASALRKLKEELKEAIPDPNVIVPEAKLAALPYLTGVIKEGLRLGHGVTSRLARVPHEPLIFPGDDRKSKGPSKQWVIPPWTPVSMTSMFMHLDPVTFPSPHEFKPERWSDPSTFPTLDKNIVAFTKGSRQCLGMNLAYVEMYLWLAKTFRRYGSRDVRFESDEGILELVDCGLEDIEIVGDRFVPITKTKNGVRFRVLP